MDVFLTGNTSERDKLNRIENILIVNECNYFSSRFNSGLLFKNKHVDFIINEEEIRDAEVMVVLLDQIDAKTLFQIGYGYGLGKPIVYLTLDKQNVSQTILETAKFVCTSYDELDGVLYRSRLFEGIGNLPKEKYVQV